MTIAYFVVTLVTIAANAGIAVADLARARFVLANSAAVDVPPGWVPALGLLKLAGAAGLAAGLAGWTALGTAAAIGLVLFFVGAVGAHVRARALRTIGAPVAYLALAGASLVMVTVAAR
ncbi:DoxX family protein [Amycolatopsis sp., V23-08]|uniref:DoxX family protein n=1 Tax=Amycolatopsis heterodermiae TaxID=3110235 RepID=A0ABU5RFA8_9PSEU|nr:DoxX family protein [Amycolatopsis sp., V23-08]MEA5364961.1 DoxX family protein [Amycolatopsis sp., V23-08]